MNVQRRPVLVPVITLVSALGLGAGGLLFGSILMLITGTILVVGLGVELTPVSALVLSLVFIQGVGCAGVALAYVAFRPEIEPVVRNLLGIPEDVREFSLGISMPNLRDLIVVVVGYVLAFGGALAGAFAITTYQRITSTEIDTGTNQVAEVGLQNPEILLWLIPASILLVGPGEELLFRGVVQGRLREVFSPVTAILIASVVFAALHWFALTGGSMTGNLVALGILSITALVLGVSYEYTGNIVVPSLIHGIYNATLFSLLYVSIAYGEELAEAEGGVLAMMAILTIA